jgi:HD-like signal output (HDOD) protein
MLDIERTVLGTDHAEVGFTVAEKWNLPHSIALAARYHHHPLEAPAGNPVCSIVHVANGLAHLFGFVSDIGEMSREVNSAVLEHLHLGSGDLQEIASNALGPIRDMGGVLEF